MKTKILICALAVATLAVGSAACGKKKSSNGAPSFSEPTGSESQIDRMGRPAINTIVKKGLDTSGNSSNVFNTTTPGSDVSAFLGPLTQIVGLAHACPAPAIAGALLPDILTFNIASNANYAQLNGRALADDVFDDTLLALYTTASGTGFCNGAGPFVTAGDNVTANDKTFSGTFPFLADPF